MTIILLLVIACILCPALLLAVVPVTLAICLWAACSGRSRDKGAPWRHKWVNPWGKP
jgi:hypothetical protein